MRIAVLILAHRDKRQLNKLLEHLAADFDLYVHLDRKSELRERDLVRSERITVMRSYAVYWGSFNQIGATLKLLRAAHSTGYDRYLLISGQDVPVKSNREIIDFFSGNHNEYIECTRLPCWFWSNGGLDRIRKYHANSDRGVTGIRRIGISVEKVLVDVLNRRAEHPREIDYEFYGGSNWFNLTHDCVDKVLGYLKRNNSYLNRYKYTFCADEIFMQTIVMMVCLPENVVKTCLRYIDWKSGPEFPRILRADDYEKIVNAGMLFARKVDEGVDVDISEMLYAVAKNNS